MRKTGRAFQMNGGGAGRRGDTQRPLPLHPEGKLRPRKRISLTRISQRRNKTRTQGVPFPRVPALVELPRPGNFPISRLNSSLGVTRSIGLKQGPQEELALPSECWAQTPRPEPTSYPTATARLGRRAQVLSHLAFTFCRSVSS